MPGKAGATSFARGEITNAFSQSRAVLREKGGVNADAGLLVSWARGATTLATHAETKWERRNICLALSRP